jgi:hypothetical protein
MGGFTHLHGLGGWEMISELNRNRETLVQNRKSGYLKI